MAVATKMTDEQVPILAHIEALISPVATSVNELKTSIERSNSELATNISELRQDFARVSERVARVEGRLDNGDTVDNTRMSTLKFIGAAVSGSVLVIAALGGFVLAIVQATN